MDTARALTENLAALLRREHGALAEFLIALAHFDERRRWVELGHSSLFYFLTRELRLSKSAAQYRKVASELIQKIPDLIEPLQRGDLCLTTIIEVAKVVTTENWKTVLPRFYGLSRREAMEVVAALQPHPAPPARTVITSVRPEPSSRSVVPAPSRALAPESAGEPRGITLTEAARAPTSLEVSSAEEPSPSVSTPAVPSMTPARPLEVVPLTAEQNRIHLTVSKEFMKKLEAARDAMPGATPTEILEAGLEMLLARAAKRKGLVERPRKTTRPAKDDHIPAHVRRVVWNRDAGKCQWPLASGGICGSTRHLELDHIHPRSLGGASTADNLRVVCRAHNDLAARRTLGDDLMNRYTSGLRGTPRRPGSAGVNDSAHAASPP
jgi:hypothetical protein